MSASASQRANQASSDSAGEDKGDSDSDYCVEPPKKRSNTGRWVRNTFFVSHPREQEVAVGVECSVEYLPSNYDNCELTYDIQQELYNDSDESHATAPAAKNVLESLLCATKFKLQIWSPK